MAKFKVGDRVRVLDGSKIEGYAGGWVRPMEEYVGNVYTIAKIRPSGSYRLKDIPFVYDERGLERAENPGKIVITTDGRITTAKLYQHGEPTLKTVATCSPEDTFDFAIGAKLVLERLIDAMNNPPFKVGDIVRVTDTGECDIAAFSWVVRHITDKSLIARYTCRCDLEDLVGNRGYTSRFRILHIAEGKAFIEKIIEKIDDFGFCCYVVGLDGLERME